MSGNDLSDPDLRRRIAERLGAKWWRHERGEWCGPAMPNCILSFYRPDWSGVEEVAGPLDGDVWIIQSGVGNIPDYPNDPGAALGLLDNWRAESPGERNYIIVSPWMLNDNYEVQLGRANRNRVFGAADTLARAACRAWLAAREQEAKR